MRLFFNSNQLPPITNRNIIKYDHRCGVVLSYVLQNLDYLIVTLLNDHL